MTFVRPDGRIAVTGATGFVGKALVEHLSRLGHQVVGIAERQEPPEDVCEHLWDYHCADLTQGWPLIDRVDGIVHLAGLAAVGPSFGQPQKYINTNSAMVTNLFEDALSKTWAGRVIVVSSGAVYGNTGNIGVTEDAPPRMSSPYVVSKLLIEAQTEYYRMRGIDAIVVRPFNHIGPGQSPGFIVPDLTEKVKRHRNGGALPVGNLDSARDYTDVRDIVNAYALILRLRNPKYGLYNVCRGAARSGWDVLAAICASLNVSVPPTEMGTDRALDPSVVIGDARRLIQDTGWAPLIGLQTSIDDFVSSQRA